METLKITIIGKDLFKIVEEKMKLAGVNTINEAKNGMLGNLTTLTLFADIPENEVIYRRGRIMEEMAKDSMRLMPMYVHGDWMRIFVMKPLVY